MSNLIKYNVFKDGKKKAVTMSFDDGVTQDVKLIEIFNKYGIKGTFHINTASFGRKSPYADRRRLPEEGFAEHYVGHELACHGTDHTSVTLLSPTNVMLSAYEDRLKLEALSGQIVRGMSYPNGVFSDEAILNLKAAGIVYNRTVRDTGETSVPGDFMKWDPSCHYSKMEPMVDRLIKNPRYAQLLYIWGHAYEFDETNNKWDLMERCCKKLSEHKDEIWFATNIEIYDYITAQRNLIISADNKKVYNPSALEVWFTCNGKVYSVKGGETVTVE